MEELFKVLREQFGKDLTDAHHAHVCGIIERFAQRAYVKYVAGVREHHGGLWEKPVIKEILWESIDMLIYADTLCEQALHEGVVYSDTEKKCQRSKK